MQITGLLLKAKIGRYLMRNGGGLDANIHPHSLFYVTVIRNYLELRVPAGGVKTKVLAGTLGFF